MFLPAAGLFGQTYVNPVITDSADPGVYYHAANGWYYIYATDYRFHRSTDLVNWSAISNPLADSGMYWAPEVFKRESDGFLYMFYTLNQRLRVAKSSSPAGPFNPIATDLTGRWSIDSTYFRDDDGKEYIYWNEGGCGGTSGIWVGELNSTLTGIISPQHCFNNVAVGAWVTECVIEAPNLLKRNGTYYLVFSGNGTGPNYKLGYATASAPRGPWTMYSGNPIMVGNSSVSGPGHCSFTTSPDGSRMFIVYHGATVGGVAGRHARVDRAEFIPNPQGGPDILDVLGPTTTAQPYPLSGIVTSVTLTNSDAAGTLSFSTKGNWNDSAAPHAGVDYFTGPYVCRVNTDTSFAGDSLTIDTNGVLAFKTSNLVTVASLKLKGGKLANYATGGSPDVARLAGSITLSNTSLLDAQAANRTLEIQAGVSGTPGLTILSSLSAGGVVRFGAVAKTYAGNTVIDSNAALQAGLANVFPSGAGKGDFTVNGALDLNDFNAGLNGLSGSGVVDNTAAGTATLTVGKDGDTSTFSGVIRNTGGALSLTKTGAGTLTLSGDNSYSGGTTIDGVAGSGGSTVTVVNNSFKTPVIANWAYKRPGGGNRFDFKTGQRVLAGRSARPAAWTTTAGHGMRPVRLRPMAARPRLFKATAAHPAASRNRSTSRRPATTRSRSCASAGIPKARTPFRCKWTAR